MRVLALKPGHDGSVALVVDGALEFCVEAEKDSHTRHSNLTASGIISALELTGSVPDVIAVGGWHRNTPGHYGREGAGYFGIEPGQLRPGHLLGHDVQFYTSSHERSHIMAAAAMAPDAPLRECVVLVWEGVIGSFYHWTNFGQDITPIPVLSQPGTRYAALYALADPTFTGPAQPRTQDAGKLMALTGYGTAAHATAHTRDTLTRLLNEDNLFPFHKSAYSDSPLHNAGLTAPIVADAAAAWSDQLFDVFADAAARHLPHGLPLVIAGGCGLNCDWNTRWATNPQFRSVAVPPCADDSGSAIGTAIDACVALGEPPALRWSVYAGNAFVHDREMPEWTITAADPDALAVALHDQQRVIAWVHGRCELGPRALGHRSLLASPANTDMRQRLNTIKKREPFRPIAPVVSAEAAPHLVNGPVLSEHMLFFTHVTDPRLPAATHVDGSARPQVVTETHEPTLHALLQAVGRRSGIDALCNTSLNYPGHGFINRLSDLVRFADDVGIDDLVIEGQWLQRRSTVTEGTHA